MELSSSKGAVRSSVFVAATCDFNPKDSRNPGEYRYTAVSGRDMFSSSLALYDTASFYVAFPGFVYSTAIDYGQLWVEYDVELKTPQLSDWIDEPGNLKVVSGGYRLHAGDGHAVVPLSPTVYTTVDGSLVIPPSTDPLAAWLNQGLTWLTAPDSFPLQVIRDFVGGDGAGFRYAYRALTTVAVLFSLKLSGYFRAVPGTLQESKTSSSSKTRAPQINEQYHSSISTEMYVHLYHSDGTLVESRTAADFASNEVIPDQYQTVAQWPSMVAGGRFQMDAGDVICGSTAFTGYWNNQIHDAWLILRDYVQSVEVVPSATPDATYNHVDNTPARFGFPARMSANRIRGSKLTVGDGTSYPAPPYVIDDINSPYLDKGVDIRKKN